MHKYANDGNVFFKRHKYDTEYPMKDMHFHNNHELYYLESGTVTYIIDNEIHILKPNDFIFIPQGTFHRNDPTVGATRILFNFSSKQVGNEYLKYLEEFSKNKYIQIAPEHLSKLKELFSLIECARGTEAFIKEMEILFLRLILVFISQYKINTAEDSLDESFHLIQEVVKYISMNCAQDLSLKALAKKYSVSPNYLSALFKSKINVGISEYINISRTTMAQTLLETTDLSITEISTRSGFNDSSYFTQVFKKIYGVTPKKYSMEVKKWKDKK